ncbi:MAG: PQQ-binding-like beta-propeller repeat protein [Planctomycetaceae bacterium]
MSPSAPLFRRWRLVIALTVSLAAWMGEQSKAQELGNFSGSLTHERNRDAEETLRLAKEHLADQEYGAAVRQLQRILDADEDSLVLEEGTFRSAWDVADDWTSHLPSVGRKAYERLFSQPAAEELSLAKRSGSEEALRRVARRYRRTTAGQQAVVLLAVSALDRGETDIAREWSRLIEPELLGVPFAAVVQRLRDIVTEQTEVIVEAATPQRPPDVSWQVEMSVTSDVRQVIAKSLSDLNAQAITPLLSATPILHGYRVFARQGGRLLAVDATSGDLLWERNIDPLMQQFTKNAAPRNRMWNATAFAVFLERLTRSSLFDQLSADDQRLFALIPGSDFNQETKTYVVKNTLAAFSLDEGQLLWTAGADAASISPDPATDSPVVSSEELSDVYFLSTPLPLGRLGLVLGQKDSKVWLLATSLHDGQLVWSVPLGQVVRTLAEDKSRQGTAGRIVVHEGRAYCGTAAGSVGCVDLLSRRLLWSTRYPRDDIPDPVVREQSNRVARDLLQHHRLPTQEAWHEVALHVADDRVIMASPDANRLFAFDAQGGHVIWTRPRDDGLFVVTPGGDNLVIIGSHSATALDERDGHELWKTSIPQPGGRGFLSEREYQFPTLNGGLLSLDLATGSSSVLSARPDGTVSADVNGRSISFSYGPPSTLRPVEPRNLVSFERSVLSQTHDRLTLVSSLSEEKNGDSENQPRQLANDDLSTSKEAESTTDEFAANVRALIEHARPVISTLIPVLTTVDVAVHVAESLIPQLKSPPHRTAELIEDVAIALQQKEPARVRLTLERLHNQPLSKVFVTDDNSGRTVRVDRWLVHGLDDALGSGLAGDDGLAALLASSSHHIASPDHSTDQAINRISPMQWEKRLGIHLWGTASPMITEAESPLDTLYVNTVPITVSDASPWEWVTVQVDRAGRNVFLNRADQASPVIIPLPNTTSNGRMMTDLLHGWAAGPLLCLRIGTELFGFHIDEKTGKLPRSISWPSPGTDASLVADQSMNMTDLQDLSSVPPPLWDDSQSGFYDLFGRPFVQVGPVTSSCVCYWDRGHLIALDPSSGSQLWSRFSYPADTHCVGDDEHMVLLRADSNTVEVLRSLDGQTVDTWELHDPFDSLDQMLSQVVAMRGVLALTHSLPQQGEARSRHGQQPNSLLEKVNVSVIDLSTGNTLWRRDVSFDAWVVRVDSQFVGLIELPGTLTLLDWQTGRELAVHQISLPEAINSVDVITLAERVFVVVSQLSDDGDVFTTQQLQNSRRRPQVNGWLHSLDRKAGKYLWESHLENVGFPLDQSRHVPMLVAGYSVRSADSQVPIGVLRCYDTRSGNVLYEATRSNHIYHTFRADITQQQVQLQLRQQTVTFDYSTTE